MNIEEYIILFLLVLAAINFLALSIDVLLYKFDIDYSEGFMFYGLKNMDRGIPIYQNSNDNSFNIVKYPPLFFLISYPFYKIFGLNLISLRLVSGLFFMGTIIVLFRFLIKIRKDYFTSIIFTLFPISSTVIFWQTFQARPEWTAMFLSIYSIFLAYIYGHKKDEKFFYFSLIFANLAFLTKQTFFSSLVAIMIFHRNKIFQIIKLELLFATVLLIFNYLTGNSFLLHLTEFSKGLFLYRANLMNAVYIQYGLLFVLSVIVTFLLKEKKYDLIKTCFLISLTFNFILLLRHGSWIYYLIEPIIYSSILLYIFFSKCKDYLLRYSISLMILISIFIWNIQDTRILTYMFNSNNYVPKVNHRTDIAIEQYVKNNDGNCYTENPSYLFSYNEIPPEPWLMIEIFKNGIINEGDFDLMNYDCLIFYDRFSEFPNFNEIISSYSLKDKLTWTDLNANKLNVLFYEK